jgi:hypothetical protein
MTEEEVISWFQNNWFTFMDSNLNPISKVHTAASGGGAKFLTASPNQKLQHLAKLGADDEPYTRLNSALVHRVANIIDRHTETDKGGFLTWKSH